MFLLPEGPRRLPERATRTAQYVGIVYQCSAAPHSPLPFLLLFDLRISYHSRSQMPLLTNYARDAISINGRTLELFQSVTFLFIKNSGWTKTRQTTLQKNRKKKRIALATFLMSPVLYCTYALSYNICLVS